MQVQKFNFRRPKKDMMKILTIPVEKILQVLVNPELLVYKIILKLKSVLFTLKCLASTMQYYGFNDYIYMHVLLTQIKLNPIADFQYINAYA